MRLVFISRVGVSADSQWSPPRARRGVRIVANRPELALPGITTSTAYGSRPCLGSGVHAAALRRSELFEATATL